MANWQDFEADPEYQALKLTNPDRAFQMRHQFFQSNLAKDPDFLALPPDRQTRFAYQFLHEKPFDETPGPETIPGRIGKGVARGFTETVGGLAGLPGALYGAIKGTPETVKTLAGKGGGTWPPETTIEDIAARPEYEVTKGMKPEDIPILGPIGQQYGESFGRDPAEATGRAAFDVFTYLAGLGGKAGGAKAAEATAAAEKAALAKGIPGAPVTAMEARKGIFPALGRAIAASPLGESRVAGLAAEREPGISAAIEKLTQQGMPEGPTVRPETLFGEAPTQAGAGQAVKAGIKAHKGRIRGIESKQWTNLENEIENRGIRPGLENTIQAAAPLYATSKEAFDLMASQLSPEAQRILQRTVSQDPLLLNAPTSMGVNVKELMSAIPPEQRGGIIQQLQPEGASWGAVKEIRTKIGDMIEAKLKTKPIGDPETRALTILRDALTKDMKASLEGNPDLLKQFETASATTTIKHKTFGKGMPGGIIRKEPKVQPSEIVGKGIQGTPEQARALRRAVGPEAEGAEALKSGSMRELLERHTGKKGTDYAAALEDLTSNPNYKRLMGDEGYRAAQNSLIAQSKGQATEALTDIFQRSTKGKLGDPDAVFDGPGFASRWQNARTKFEKMGLEPSHLSALDEFAKEAGKLGLSKKAATRAAAPGYGGYFTMGHLIGGIVSTAAGIISGHPAIGAAVPLGVLTGERALMNIMMQPEGPRLLSRAIKLQKIGKPLGETADALAKLAIVAPKEEEK